jgi:hypothetical protein
MAGAPSSRITTVFSSNARGAAESEMLSEKKSSDKSADPKRTQRRTKSAGGKPSSSFTAEERAAMKEHAQELKGAALRGRGTGEAEGEKDVLAKIAQMPEPDRTMAGRLHELIKAAAPGLVPRTWYGMPAYARDGNVVCFFQSRQKFKTRYATLGFSDKANLDNGRMWPSAFALKELTAEEEARITELVKRAVD